MNKLPVLVLVLMAACPLAYAYDSGDFQIWNTDYEDINIAKSTRVSMEQEFRFGENASELYYHHYEFGIFYNFDKRFDLGLCYRIVYDKYKRNFRQEDMPNVNATLKLDLWKFKFDDRNRIEYRHFRYKDDSVRYRNKFTLKLPLDFKRINISPYASDEIFVSSDSTGYNENRFSGGLEFGLTKYAKADLYYMLKNNKIKEDKWSCANVLGTKIKIAF